MRLVKDSSSQQCLLVGVSGLGLTDCCYLSVMESSPWAFWGCSSGSACSEILSSPFARPYGIPLCYLGLLVYAVSFLFALNWDRLPTRLGRAWSSILLLANFVGGGLIAIQSLVYEQLCPYCLLSFGSSFVLYILWTPPKPNLQKPFRWLIPSIIVASMLFVSSVFATHFEVGEYHPKPVPREAGHWLAFTNTGPTVIYFFDYGCPTCRRLSAALMAEVKSEKNIRLCVLPISIPADAQISDRYLRLGESLDEPNFWRFYKLAMSSGTYSDFSQSFESRLNPEEALRRIHLNSTLASEFGVGSVPALYVEGRRLRSASVGQLLSLLRQATSPLGKQ